jgi:hypothetical protein
MIPNIDPETGTHYGVIASNSLASWVFEQAASSGVDIDYEEARQELLERLNDAVASERQAASEHAEKNMDSAIEELIDACMESYESTGDQMLVRYETTHEGQPLIVQFTGGSEMWVFKSPIVVRAAKCSPCFPNAGDLDNVYDEPDAGVPTYGLPTDWRAKSEERNDDA